MRCLSPESIIKKYRNKVDALQINIIKSEETSVLVRNNSPDEIEYSENDKILVKAVKNSRIGYANSNTCDINIIEQAIINSKKMPRTRFSGLPERQQIPRVKTADRKIKELNEQDLLDIGHSCCKMCTSNKLLAKELELRKIITKRQVINTNGINYEEETAMLYADIYLFGRRTSFFDSKSITKLQQFEGFFNDAVILSKSFQNISRTKTIPKNIIFSPRVFADILDYALIPNFSCENNTFVNKLNKRLFNNNISIYDDATMDFGVYSSSFDFEGNPTRQNILLDRGVIKNVFLDYETAKELHRKPTGNSSEAGTTRSNIIVAGHNADLIDGVSSGIYIEEMIGLHNSDFLSTNFSGEISKAFLIKNSELANPVYGPALSMNLIDVLRTAVLGDDAREYDGILCPSILVRNNN